MIAGTDLKDDPLWCSDEPNDALTGETLLAFHGKDYCLSDMFIHQDKHFVCEQG